MTRRLVLGLALCSFAGSAAAVETSSVIFYDYTHDATENGTEDGSFELTRAYITFTDKPAENLSYKLQFDVGRAGSDTEDVSLEAYIKSASVDWKTDLGKWTFGMQGMNMFNVQESNFGNRFLAKPLMDQYKFSSSADLGVGYSISFGELFKASVLYTNGTGYKKPENDKYKKLSLQVMAGEPALNKNDGWNAGVVYSMEPTSPDFSKTVMGLFGGWAGLGLRLGAEFDTYTVGGDTDVTKQVIGFYGNYKLPLSLPVEAVVQMAMADPNTDADDDGETDLILGLKFNPAKGLVISPNIHTVSFENGDMDPETYYRLNFEFKI